MTGEMGAKREGARVRLGHGVCFVWTLQDDERMDQTFQKRDGMEPAEPQLKSSLAGMSFQMVGDEGWTWR